MKRRAPKRPGVKQYDRAPSVGIQRSTFDRSHPWKGTFNSGELIPFLVEEILPGDSYRLRANIFCRLATPLHPTLDNLHLSTHFFFVPNRLVWDNWQKFMGEQDDPGDSTDFTIPQYSNGNVGEGTPMDYVGLPVGSAITVNELPFRGMHLIWNQWYRDENLQDSLVVPTGDAGGATSFTSIQRRGKRKTYITSCLPWPQKGPGVDLPLGTKAEVAISGIDGDEMAILSPDQPTGTGASTMDLGGGSHLTLDAANAPGNIMYADLSTATSATINELRQAFQIQKLYERDARGGTRYTEILKSHFQVISPDSRLQRAEYLGGGTAPIGMATVPQTSSTDATTPQGNLSAYGTAMATGHGFTKSFVEHGYVIGYISVRADLNFQQNIERKWSRLTKHDFYWPALQALGEQPVYNREVYSSGGGNDALVWGYQERWSEYRTCEGKITGLFRSDLPTSATLDPWHYALDFQSGAPTLNATFIEDVPPVKRTIAVQTEPDFLCDTWFDIKAARPMPVYSVPGYIDHF